MQEKLQLNIKEAVGESEPVIAVSFNPPRQKQQILVDALLKYSELSVADLAIVLDIPMSMLRRVRDGKCFFIEEQANNLTIAFLTLFGE